MDDVEVVGARAARGARGGPGLRSAPSSSFLGGTMASPYESERNPFAAPPPPLDDGIAPVGSLGRINERQPSAVASAVCFFKSSTRPLTAFFHIAFKAGSIVLYLFGNFAGLDFITVFVGTVLMLAFDFWTCKVGSTCSSRARSRSVALRASPHCLALAHLLCLPPLPLLLLPAERHWPPARWPPLVGDRARGRL